MTSATNPNLTQLIAVARKLEPLLDQIAFVGGCITGLLITDPAAGPVRATLDVDAIIELTSYIELMAIENRLREMGFRQSPAQDVPICRWFADDLILDLMPIDHTILGFSNRWYRPALANSQRLRIGEQEIRLITAPYFLATKLEAFHGRGHNDFQTSRDLEDIVTIIDGRPELIEEAHLATDDLQKYLSDEFRNLISNRGFQDALPGYLLPDAASQQRLDLVLERMRKLISKH